MTEMMMVENSGESQRREDVGPSLSTTVAWAIHTWRAEVYDRPLYLPRLPPTTRGCISLSFT